MKTFNQNLAKLEFSKDAVARPAAKEAVELAEATGEMLKALDDFVAAKKSVPSYTGPNSDEMYYVLEEDRFNRAAERHADAVVAVMRAAMS